VNVREADCGIVPDSKTYSVRTFAQDSPPPASPAFSIGRARTFRLDSIGGRVGDRLNMILFVDPPLTDADNVTGFRLWLSLNPDALYPHSATSGGAAARLDYSADGRVTIERSGRRTPVIGEELMELELEGLVTGRSTNVVRIDSLEFMGTTLSRIGGDGLVLLTGCEIGKRFAKGAAIVSLVPNPVVDRVDIGYRSTEGLPMSIRLLDMQGRLMLEKDLGPGDGTEGSVAIGLQGVSSGLYMLELRDGVKVETAPLLIRR